MNDCEWVVTERMREMNQAKTPLSIALFGPVTVWVAGQRRPTPHRQKCQWLLALLTLQTLCLDLADAEVDLLAFDEAIARGDLTPLETAVALYRDSLVAGCTEAW